MISLKRLTHATDTAVVALIIFHLVVWFQSMGGSEGITGNASYPFSLFVVPVTIWVTALAVFYALIYPLALGVQFTCNRIHLSRLHGLIVFVIAVAALSAWPARAYGGSSPMATWLIWIGYLAAGFSAFWHYGTREA